MKNENKMGVGYFKLLIGFIRRLYSTRRCLCFALAIKPYTSDMYM